MPQNKQRRRLTKQQSIMLCEAYKVYKGKWDSIMNDKEVKALGFTQSFLRQHVNNKKKNVKNAVSDSQKGMLIS